MLATRPGFRITPLARGITPNGTVIATMQPCCVTFEGISLDPDQPPW